MFFVPPPHIESLTVPPSPSPNLKDAPRSLKAAEFYHDNLKSF